MSSTASLLYLSPWQRVVRTTLYYSELEYNRRNEIMFLGDISACAFGRVFKASLPADGRGRGTVAVKMLAMMCRATFDLSLHALQQRSRHSVTLTLSGWLESVYAGRRSEILLEYMDSGDLREFLRLRDPDGSGVEPVQPLNCVQRVGMASHVAGAWAYLTSRGFAHRDVASRNFLVSSGELASTSDPVVKLSDFMLTVRTVNGVCHCVDDAEALPVRWMSPEAITTGQFSQASDVWAFGVLLWELFSHARQPFSDIDTARVAKHICAGGTLSQPTDMPDSVFRLVQRCWHREPARRPTFDELLKALFTERSQRLVMLTANNSNNVSTDRLLLATLTKSLR